MHCWLPFTIAACIAVTTLMAALALPSHCCLLIPVTALRSLVATLCSLVLLLLPYAPWSYCLRYDPLCCCLPGLLYLFFFSFFATLVAGHCLHKVWLLLVGASVAFFFFAALAIVCDYCPYHGCCPCARLLHLLVSLPAPRICGFLGSVNAFS